MIPASSEPSSAKADVRTAYQLVRDLFTPRPICYWRELAVTGSLAWAAFALAVVFHDDVVVSVSLVCLAVPFWYRAVVMVHELTHQRRDEIPGFHTAWNLAIGIVWLLPSVMYERVHNGHHRKTTYGTTDDPEYLPLAGHPWAIAGYLGFAFVALPLLFLRFLLLAPLSWLVPPLRRFLIRSGSSYTINLRFVRAMSARERRSLFLWECTVLLVWWPVFALTLSGNLPWQWLPCWYAIYSATLFANRLRMLTAHHFASDGHPMDHLGQFRDSIDSPHGWWAEVWAPLGLRYHALHHLFPTLPFHNMRTAYGRLAQQLPAESFYHEAAGRGLLPSLRRLVTRSGRR